MNYVKTGGCYDTNERMIKCAFESVECFDDNNDNDNDLDGILTFVSSQSMKDDRNHHPCSVREQPIGRCTSRFDTKVSCTHKEEVCGYPVFDANDQECEIGSDSTAFGACAPLEAQGEEYKNGPHCVWSKEECTSGKDNWVDGSLISNLGGGCGCEDVKTGACLSTTTDTDTNILSYYCAVSELGCSLGDTYIPMREWNVDDNDAHSTVDCRLCAPISTTIEEPLTLRQEFVQLGACYQDDPGGGGTFQKCAFEPSDCNNKNDLFFSSYDLKMDKMNDGLLNCGDKNSANDSIIGLMGRCTMTLDSVECTNRAESCKYPSDFQEKDQTCTLHHHLTTNKDDYTRFPICTNSDMEYSCVWSKDDCYRSRLGLHGPAIEDCDCSSVHTGACKHADGTYYCATSPMACGDETQFLDIRTALQEHSLDCRLCQGENNDKITNGIQKIIPQPPSAFPTTEPKPSPTSQIPLMNSEPITTRASSTTNSGAMAGVIIGVVSAVFCIVGIGTYYYVQNKKKTKNREPSSEGIVLSPDGDTMQQIEKIGDHQIQ